MTDSEDKKDRREVRRNGALVAQALEGMENDTIDIATLDDLIKSPVIPAFIHEQLQQEKKQRQRQIEAAADPLWSMRNSAPGGFNVKGDGIDDVEGGGADEEEKEKKTEFKLDLDVDVGEPRFLPEIRKPRGPL